MGKPKKYQRKRRYTLANLKQFRQKFLASNISNAELTATADNAKLPFHQGNFKQEYTVNNFTYSDSSGEAVRYIPEKRPTQSPDIQVKTEVDDIFIKEEGIQDCYGSENYSYNEVISACSQMEMDAQDCLERNVTEKTTGNTFGAAMTQTVQQWMSSASDTSSQQTSNLAEPLVGSNDDNPSLSRHKNVASEPVAEELLTVKKMELCVLCAKDISKVRHKKSVAKHAELISTLSGIDVLEYDIQPDSCPTCYSELLTVKRVQQKIRDAKKVLQQKIGYVFVSDAPAEPEPEMAPSKSDVLVDPLAYPSTIKAEVEDSDIRQIELLEHTQGVSYSIVLNKEPDLRRLEATCTKSSNTNECFGELPLLQVKSEPQSEVALTSDQNSSSTKGGENYMFHMKEIEPNIFLPEHKKQPFEGLRTYGKCTSRKTNTKHTCTHSVTGTNYYRKCAECIREASLT